MPTPKRATDLADMETEFLECRDLGHAWQRTSDQHVVFGARKKPIEFVRVIWCPRCDTTRSQTIDLTTWSPSKGNKYHYPDGYLIVSTGERMHRSDYRQELINRIININTGRARRSG
jgi:hypothetical protein